MKERLIEGESQINRFRKASRELETDDNEVRLNERLGKLVNEPLCVSIYFGVTKTPIRKTDSFFLANQ